MPISEAVWTVDDNCSEPMPDSKYTEALKLIDQAHAEDPNKISVNGRDIAYELHYSEQMSRYLELRRPNAPDVLRLAIRAQHLKRWEVPRDSYPMGKVGYHAWRSFLKKRQAETVRQICLDCGYPDDDAARVASLVRKENPKDEETQILEDVACLVFLDDQFEKFEKNLEEDKIVTILKKTWDKMSDEGHNLALGISMSARAQKLVATAIN